MIQIPNPKLLLYYYNVRRRLTTTTISSFFFFLNKKKKKKKKKKNIYIYIYNLRPQVSLFSLLQFSFSCSPKIFSLSLSLSFSLHRTGSQPLLEFRKKRIIISSIDDTLGLRNHRKKNCMYVISN